MSDANQSSAFIDLSDEDLRSIFDRTGYVAEDDIVTTVLLSLRLEKPLLVEGEPGCGKTELGKVLAEGFDTDLIRLQCYEGLTAESALYEWNYAKQLLTLQADERAESHESVFSEDFLLERPLLRALSHEGNTPPVLLIDEIDRADEEFEALLLEILSDFQISIPELGTIGTDTPPIVVITSNQTRGLSDALKRRCVYLHIGPPSFEKERELVRQKVPDLEAPLASESVAFIQELRKEPLLKRPGVSETFDQARAVAMLREPGQDSLSEVEIEHAIGTVLKEGEDIGHVTDGVMDEMLSAAKEATKAGE